MMTPRRAVIILAAVTMFAVAAPDEWLSPAAGWATVIVFAAGGAVLVVAGWRAADRAYRRQQQAAHAERISRIVERSTPCRFCREQVDPGPVLHAAEHDYLGWGPR